MLVLADMNEEQLKEVVDQIVRDGGAAVMRKTNVADEEEVRKLVALALDTYSQVDILCNNAGISGGYPSVEDEDAVAPCRAPIGARGVCGALVP